VVVDNGSRDDSLTGIEELELPLHVLRNGENRGFAAACNQGAAAAGAETILFLNPDARLEAGSLQRPLQLLSDPAHAAVGIVGIQLQHLDGTVARSCARIPDLRQLLAHTIGLDRLSPRLFPGVVMREWDHARSAYVGHVIGAFLLIRRSLFEQLGGFDEQFFVYYEDLDLSARAAAAGVRTCYLVEARAYHRGGGTSEQAPVERLCYVRAAWSGMHKHQSCRRLVNCRGRPAAGIPHARAVGSRAWQRCRRAPRRARTRSAAARLANALGCRSGEHASNESGIAGSTAVRLLVLTTLPVEAPGERLRVYQYLPWFEQAGVEVTVDAIYGSQQHEVLGRPGGLIPKTAGLARGLVRRLVTLLRADRYDAALVYRQPIFFWPGLAERVLHAHGVPYVFDFDDSIYLRPPEALSPLAALLRPPAGVARTVAGAACTVVGNQLLADYALQHSQLVEVIPTTVDTDRFRPVPADAGTPRQDVVIGWLVSPTTVRYLRLILPVLESLVERYPQLRVRVVGGAMAAEHARIESAPWSLAGEARELAGFDIGVMPLSDDEWTRGKCGLKLIQYMAAGLPVVASPVGVNREIVRAGVNGYLAATEREWVAALARLIESAALRRELGAPRIAEAEYSLSMWAPRYLAILRQAAQVLARAGLMRWWTSRSQRLRRAVWAGGRAPHERESLTASSRPPASAAADPRGRHLHGVPRAGRAASRCTGKRIECQTTAPAPLPLSARGTGRLCCCSRQACPPRAAATAGSARGTGGHGAARRRLEQQLGRLVTQAELVERLRQSGMTRAQARARLRQAGYDPALADQYFDVLERGGEPQRASRRTRRLRRSSGSASPFRPARRRRATRCVTGLTRCCCATGARALLARDSLERDTPRSSA
jgi:GT2 family glycosyltransferase/glycosyltransferase involved in cell wall biosynthesis